MPPRRISFLPALCERFLIWSEASYEAGTGELGFVLFDPELDGSGFLYSEGLMPQDLHDLLVPKQQQIVQREIIAAIAPYLSLPDLLRDRDVIHWIDNTSAISCLLHGYSSKPDSARLTNVFHLLNASLRAKPFFEYVESRANIADLPSRGDFDLLRAMLAVRVPLILPSVEEWEQPLRYWLTRAAPKARHSPRSSVNGRKRGRSVP